jgi:hypothetical protein
MNILSTIAIVFTVATMRASALILIELQGRGCVILSFGTSTTKVIPIVIIDAVVTAVESTPASQAAGVERSAATEATGEEVEAARAREEASSI